MTIQIEGYTTGGEVGFGAREAATTVVRRDGTACVAVTIDDGDRVGPLRDLALLRHPALPGIIEVAPIVGGGAALVMESVVGPSLTTLVEARGKLSDGEIVELWAALADAVAALHARGIVHGDISPPNILVTEDGPVLIDIAGHERAQIGRYGYVPPEVLAGSPADERSDVWALARVLAWAAGDRSEVLAALGTALGEEPAARPAARAFSTWHHLLGAAVPIAVPEAARLAGAHLRAEQRPTVLLEPRSAPPWKAIGMVAAAIVATMVLIRAGAPAGVPTPEQGDAVATATALLAARDEAITAKNQEALARIYTPDSAALQEDLEVIAALNGAGITLEGYASELRGAETVACGDGECVQADVIQGAHRRVDAAGMVRQIEEQQARCVLIRLEQDLVANISPCP